VNDQSQELGDFGLEFLLGHDALIIAENGKHMSEYSGPFPD
jgi:hypothetical protein